MSSYGDPMRERLSMLFDRGPRRCAFDIPPEVREEYLRLFREGHPIDLTPLALIEAGASRLLGGSGRDDLLTRSPKEEMAKLEEDVSSLREQLQEETANREELHRSLLRYEEDRTIIGYYYETLDGMVKRMWVTMRGGG